MDAVRSEMPSIPWNPPRGTVVLAGITNVPVACPELDSTSLIFLSILVPGGTIGQPWVSSRTPGVGFSVATVALGTSTVAWMVVPN